MSKLEILSISPLPSGIEAALDRDYQVHRREPDALGQVDWAPLAGVRGLVTGGGTGARPEWLDRLPALEIIAINGVGLDRIDLEDAARRRLRVTNTPDVLTADVADLAVGLMIAVARRIVVNDRFVRGGHWLNGHPPLARSLGGLRVGIVGLGRIGLAIARRCAPMTGPIAYFGRTRREEHPYRHEPDLVALARDSDVLFVAASGHLRGLVDVRVIEALGPKGLLINISRGAVVDETALVEALVEGRLGGAGLDVFAHEPMAPEALLALDNVVLQPHVGSATVQVRTAMGRLVLDNLAAHFAGQPLVTPVV